MPFFVGALVFWIFNTTSGFTALLSMLTYMGLQAVFGFWTITPGEFDNSIALTFFFFWAIYYGIAKLFFMNR